MDSGRLPTLPSKSNKISGCWTGPLGRKGQTARADSFSQDRFQLTWPAQNHTNFALILNLAQQKTSNPFFLLFFSSLSLKPTIHHLLHISFSFSYQNIYLFQDWTPDSDSPRRRALGRTAISKLLAGWILGLLQIQSSNHHLS